MSSLGRHGHCSGGHRSPTWYSWRSMVVRCTNPVAKNYDIYGGRGVTVCDRWNPKRGGTFSNFLADMGLRPEGRTLDRIDSHGNYEPNNCRWATSQEQGWNKRNSPPPHGTESRYTNYRCRCAACKEASRLAHKARRYRRKVAANKAVERSGELEPMASLRADP